MNIESNKMRVQFDSNNNELKLSINNEIVKTQKDIAHLGKKYGRIKEIFGSAKEFKTANGDSVYIDKKIIRNLKTESLPDIKDLGLEPTDLDAIKKGTFLGRLRSSCKKILIREDNKIKEKYVNKDTYKSYCNKVAESFIKEKHSKEEMENYIKIKEEHGKEHPQKAPLEQNFEGDIDVVDDYEGDIDVVDVYDEIVIDPAILKAPPIELKNLNTCKDLEKGYTDKKVSFKVPFLAEGFNEEDRERIRKNKNGINQETDQTITGIFISLSPEENEEGRYCITMRMSDDFTRDPPITNLRYFYVSDEELKKSNLG